MNDPGRGCTRCMNPGRAEFGLDDSFLPAAAGARQAKNEQKRLFSGEIVV
jgi:hypothetical protein